MIESKHRLKVLFLSSWFPHKSSPTLGNFVHRHAQAISTLHDVYVLYLAPSESTSLHIDHGHLEDIPHTTAYIPSNKGVFYKVRIFQSLMDELSKKVGSFDIIHHNVIWPEGWQAYLASRKWGIPYVITEHWTGFDKDERGVLPWKIKFLARFIGKRAAAIMPVSSNLGEAMKKQGIHGNYITVPNVVNESLFHIGEKNNSEKVFLHVSTFDEAQKNISGILRAWKEFSQEKSNVKLLIGGDGDNTIAKNYAHSLGIRSDSITFFSKKSWEEIAEMMAMAHALVIFSNYENLPCVMIEALSSGMKVIATNVGGISECVHDGNGILIPKRDEKALVHGLQSIANEPYDETKAQALKISTDMQYGFIAVAKKFDAVYKKSLG